MKNTEAKRKVVNLSKRKKSQSKKEIVILVAVIIALVAIYLRIRKSKSTAVGQITTVTPEKTESTFLRLIDERYKHEELIKWNSPLPMASKPDEPGDLGSAVFVPPELQEEANERFFENGFNVIANELMSVNRTLSDHRYPECLRIRYPKRLPSVSVIIVFHNEAWSALTRTIWSVITQSPTELLKEIILVDDYSEHDFLGQKLDDFIADLPVTVVLVRQEIRKGLIQARLEGEKRSTADVIVFLDAHCECNRGWLEPLLTPIVRSRSTVVVPVIDSIDRSTMAVVNATSLVRGGFDMALTFAWLRIPQDQLTDDRTTLYRQPIMAGGIFAIDKEYFNELGTYDGEMEIWGSENVELSLRIWMCGGRILSAPCSRVGHIFRGFAPYELPGGVGNVIAKNKARFVDVWLDDYKKIFYTVVPMAVRWRSDVSDRIALRMKLECKSFDWFLQNIFPDSIFSVDYLSINTIESVLVAGHCLDTMERRDYNPPVELNICDEGDGNQAFMLTKANEFKVTRYCLDATSRGSLATFYECHGEKGNQYWEYDSSSKQIKHVLQKSCLTAHLNRTVTIEECDKSPSQQWLLKARDSGDL